jgi:hypothetical protein
LVKIALLLVACAGCDQVLGISEVPPTPGPGGTYDRCATPAAPDPLRYKFIPDSFAASSSWEDYRTACLIRGMDLAVIADPREANQNADALWAYWIGARKDAGVWETVDGCPAAAFLPAEGPTGCGAVFGPLDAAATSCDGVLPPVPPDEEPSRVLGALCETPRPLTAECLPHDPMLETYVVSSELMTYSAAKRFCTDQGLHLIVLSSADEMPLLELVNADAWLGATFDGKTWRTETGCPGLYSWTDVGPVIDTDIACATSSFSAPNPGVAPTMQGIATAHCAEQHYAICESD